MKDVASLVTEWQQKKGAGAAQIGSKVVDVERLPTDVFAFDLASGGGFPIGKMSIVYGPESSGKTNLVLKALGNAQRREQDKKVVFVDVEHSFDAKWAATLGVNVNDIVLLHPDFGEQAIDMVEAFTQAIDVSTVVVDSLAALTPVKQAESSADRTQVGGNAMLIGDLMRKCLYSMSRMAKQDHYPTLLMVNQVRTKIGVMFGDPENQPGGHYLRHMSGLTVRIYGSNVLDKSVSTAMPAHKKTTATFKKWKVPIVNINCQYDMMMIPQHGFKPGEVDDWNTVGTYLRNYGWLEKGKTRWILKGPSQGEFKTLDAIKKALYAPDGAIREYKRLIIERALAEAHGMPMELHEEPMDGPGVTDDESDEQEIVDEEI